MKPLGLQIPEALERRIAIGKATSQEKHHAPVNEPIQGSTARADEEELVAKQLDDISQGRDTPKRLGFRGMSDHMIVGITLLTST
jgi:hypothetical protein